MTSSGSMLMSSTGGSDDVMDESWLQRQVDIDEHPVHTATSPPLLNHCPLDTGQSSKTAVVDTSGEQRSSQTDSASGSNGKTTGETTSDPSTGSTTSVSDSAHNSADDLGSLPQATLKVAEAERVESVNGIEEIPSKNDSERKQQELVNDVHDDSAVSASDSAVEPLLVMDNITDKDADLVNLASDEVQSASSQVVEDTRIPSDDVKSCQLSQSPQTTTETGAGGNGVDIKETEDAKQTTSTGVDSSEHKRSANPRVKTRTQTTDRKYVEGKTTVSKQRLQTNGEDTSSKKENGSSSSRSTMQAATKGKLDKTAVSSRLTANPRSKPAAENPGTENTLDKSKRENNKTDVVDPTSDNTDVAAKDQPDAATAKTSKSLTTKKTSDATTATSSTSVRGRGVVERLSSRTKKPTKDAASKDTAAVETKTRDKPEKADSRLKNPGDEEAKKTTSKTVDSSQASKNPESKTETKLSGDSSVRNPGKGTNPSTKKSTAAKSNPGPDDADGAGTSRIGESRKTIGRQRTKSTAQNATVNNPVSDGTAVAGRQTAKDPSTTGNPRLAGDGAKTAGAESKDAAPPTTKRAEQQRSVGSRTTSDEKTAPTASSGHNFRLFEEHCNENCRLNYFLYMSCYHVSQKRLRFYFLKNSVKN